MYIYIYRLRGGYRITKVAEGEESSVREPRYLLPRSWPSPRCTYSARIPNAAAAAPRACKGGDQIVAVSYAVFRDFF